MKFLLQFGGSGRGVTRWMSADQCQRRDWYYQQQGTRARCPTGGALCGTLFHAFTEIYRALPGSYDPDVVEFDLPPGTLPSDDFDEQRVEASRMFRAFMIRFPAPVFGGQLLGNEREFDLFGITGRLDALVQLPSENPFGCPAGVYVYDDKCYSRRDKNWQDQFRYSPQGWLYSIAAKHLWDLDVKGTIFNVGFRLTKPIWEHVVQPFPTEAQERFVLQWVANTAGGVDGHQGEPPRRLGACTTGKYGVCSFAKQCLGTESK